VKAVLPLLLTLKWGSFFLNSLCMQKDAENIDVCVQRKPSEYLNRKRMQEAIHAKLVGVTR
jgi:serine carboxypeptidase-like clade 2